MSKILHDFYYGKLDTLESGAEKIPAYWEAVKKKEKAREKLEKRLTAKQKEIFNEYSDLRTAEECYMAEADFLYGFRIGVKLMAEVFCEKQDE